MSRVCCVCNNTRGTNILLHRFPKDAFLEQQWREGCNLQKDVETKNLRVCSKHFKESDYKQSKGTQKYLMPHAIPEIEKQLTQQNQVLLNAPQKRPNEESPIAYNEYFCPVKKSRFAEPRYISEINISHVATPRRASRVIRFVKESFQKKTKLIKALQDKARRLRKRITKLEELLLHLRQKGLVTADAAEMMELIPNQIKKMISRKLSGSRFYVKEIRSFALTLHFYSPKAYKYVRQTWKNLLPSISTIRKWYQKIDGSPGFTQQALDAISRRASGSKKPIVNLVMDEMAIRSQKLYDRHGFQGLVDLGTFNFNMESDSGPIANSAFVLMAVSLNDHWKIPIGYFLIRSLTGEERASIITEALHALNNCGAIVYSITFDGAHTNSSMCKCLGANLTYGPDFKPYFSNPATGENCYIFYDFCHMIKLVRNCLCDKRRLKTSDGQIIDWKYFELLHKLQVKEGLRTANKITKTHVYYKNNITSVKLAMQLLSKSVSNSFTFLRNLIPDKKINKKFKGSAATAEFCLLFNNLGDILNSKNRFSKDEFKAPLMDTTFEQLKCHAQSFEQYIAGLKNFSDTPILETARKTGFLGIIICLRNIFPLYDILKKHGMSYLLGYKLSQDFLETFFSAIRARGGFNNNPNAIQFKSAYRRLLVRHELKQVEGGNCAFDGVPILQASSTLKKEAESNYDLRPTCDYINGLWGLSVFVDNVVRYIAGFVVWKITSKINCDICKEQLLGEEMPTLSKLKNMGPYLAPSRDVCDICLVCESVIRQETGKSPPKNIKHFLVAKVFRSLKNPFTNDLMNDHVQIEKFYCNDLFNDHRITLCKSVISFYIDSRLFYESFKETEGKSSIRKKFTKLILFANQ